MVRNQGDKKDNIPIALYNDGKLVNKRSFSIDANIEKTIEFTFPNTTNFKGKLQITYNDIFLFDNSFFFTANSKEKINVLNIGKESDILQKIFDEKLFKYAKTSLQSLNYNAIPEQQLIVLNELSTLPNILQSTLIKYLENGGHLLLIPSNKADINSYNSFLKMIGNGQIVNKKIDSLKITDINFEHPLYSNVFSKKVDNFQYPSVSLSYLGSLIGDPIISFENKQPFLQELKNPYSKIYWFSSPLDAEYSNFRNSPLIVPTIYNIGKQSLEVSKPFYTLQKMNDIEIGVKVRKDEILHISNKSDSFIPLQQSFANKVKLSTETLPTESGFYNISSKNDTLETIAYNLQKEESLLTFYGSDNLKNDNNQIKLYDSVKDLFEDINEKNEVRWLWKLFLAIAIVSLLLEILILEFFKI